MNYFGYKVIIKIFGVVKVVSPCLERSFVTVVLNYQWYNFLARCGRKSSFVRYHFSLVLITVPNLNTTLFPIKFITKHAAYSAVR
ncbi:hypothetical protein HanRHA438_Chr14g0670551 [Helianthus annuus]|nr:hypothetical protein HanIR_Chr14g0715721 [Helianthus annuus]KAJ0855176.1 hypothetical protein HanRHA438_Chr14g0670551 [Helianthus annuus]